MVMPVAGTLHRLPLEALLEVSVEGGSGGVNIALVAEQQHEAACQTLPRLRLASDSIRCTVSSCR